MSGPTTPPDLGELGDLDDLVAAYRRRRLIRFAPTTLLWLAALPEWTDRLAAEAGFPPPPDPTPLPALLDGLESAGFLARRPDVDPDGEPVTAFWLPASRRAEVGDVLRSTRKGEDGQPELTGLVRDLGRLAERIAALPAERRDVLDTWLQIVRWSRADASGAALLARVDGLIGHGRATEALSLVGAAQALADLLGEPLSSSARRAQWRIDRSYREALDARSLRHHLERAEVDAALEEVLGGPGDVWALHLLGDGGVGKTMTIRDLSSGRLARRMGVRPFPVARIDFDHLDPRYPDARPGELIAALSGELAPYSTTRQAEYGYRRTDDAVWRLHEAAADPTGHLSPALLDAAVEAFAGHLRALDGPVVLVLDTCEELAKLHPPGGRAPAVDQTFALIERLHARAPHTRVVFAGRRWLVPHSDGGAGGLVLDPRPYLRVVPVAGFTPAQADAYLDLRDPDGTLPGPLRSALLTRSTGSAQDGTANPFDLACYCGWALAEPDLDPGTLLAGDADPYIEQRVIARLPGGAVRDCLAVTVELGRFDRALMAPELGRRGVDVEAAFSGLVGQEWVSTVTFDADGRARVIEVDENLRPRMRAALAAQPARFPLDRPQLGRDLAAHLQTCPLDELAVSALETALRLLAPPEAGALWEQLEERIAATPGAWAWAGQATARAAAAEAPRAAGTGPTVLAAIHATQAAALLRRPGAPGRPALWREVERLAGRHPYPAVAARLAFRAVCALAGTGDDDATRRLVSCWPDRPALVDDSLVATLDGLAAAGVLPAPLGPALDALCRSDDPQIAVTALLARASVRYANGVTDAAVADVDAALRRADAAEAAARPRVHWVPASRLRDRARLARLVLAMARSEPPTSVPLLNWRDEAYGHLDDDVDAERLVAASLLLEHCWRPVARADARRFSAADVYRPDRQPTHSWHRAVPSLCETVALSGAALGDVRWWADLLRRRREAAVASGVDPVTIDACERALAALSRACRTTALTSHVVRAARDDTAAARFDVWATLALVRGESPGSPDEAGGWSTWFRTQIVRAGVPFFLPSAPPDDAADLDRLEMRRMVSRDDVGNELDTAARRAVARGLVLDHGDCADLGAALRAGALTGWSADGELLLNRLPPRLVAATALAEAELLALRLPAVAVDLLWYAVRRARAAGDPALAGHAAVLLVLSASRAGLDITRTGAECRSAVTDMPIEDPSVSGWLSRRDLAVALLEDPARRSHGSADGSPELDPRSIGGGPTTVGETGGGPLAVAPAGELPSYGLPTTGPPPRPDSAQPASVRRPLTLALVAVALVVLGGLAAFGVLLTRSAGSAVVAPPPTAGAEPAGPTPANTPTAQASTGNAGGPAGTRTAGDTPSPQPRTSPPATSQPTTPPPSSTGSGSSVWPWWVIAIVVAVGGMLVAGFVWTFRTAVRQGRSVLRRPGLREHAAAYPSAARSAEPLSCRLSATPEEVVLTAAQAPRFRRRSRWAHPVVALLGQRHGNAGRPDEQEFARRISTTDGTEPLVVRFRQVRLPITWRLWEAPPGAGTPIATDFRGPPALAPADAAGGAADEPRPDSVRYRAVLHLVGTPVSTAAGWRLRIAAAVSSSTGYVKASRGVHEGETLLGPDDLAVDATALAVLQAEPVDGPPEPLGERYAGMCALATDLRDAGAGAVLVVPPLSDALARATASRIRIAMTARGRRTHPVHVLDLAQAVKDDVAAAEGRSRNASRDVLLFA